MDTSISTNTQAILLLTAPLITAEGAAGTRIPFFQRASIAGLPKG